MNAPEAPPDEQARSGAPAESPAQMAPDQSATDGTATQEAEATFGTLTPKEAADFIREHQGKESFSLLDVRTAEEFGGGHLENAANLDFYAADFEAKLGALPRERTYVVYCRSGGRSGKTLGILKKLGFNKAYHISGGITQWKADSLPIVDPAGDEQNTKPEDSAP